MHLKFLCLNVWQGGNLMENILNFLEKENPDILVLQEVYNGTDPDLAPKYRTIETIQELFHFPAFDFAPAFTDNRAEGKIVQGNAVFSKFPIISRKVTFFNEPYNEEYVERQENFPICPRNLQHVTLKTDAGELNIFNLQGPWDLAGDHYSERRQNMEKVILQEIAGKQNVIVAGDTNATPGNPAIQALEKALHSVFAGELTTTFNMRRKSNPGYATAVVDMILLSPNIEVLDKSCPDINISDHLPLVATFRI